MILTSIILLILLFGVDILSKYLAQSMLVGKDIPILGDWLGLSYATNDGGPYGVFGGNIVLLIIASLVALLLIAFSIYYFRKTKLASIALSIILAGALGNVYDRIVFGYVRDMIRVSIGDFGLTNFVCNIADIYLWIGVIMFAIILLFFHKEDKVITKDAENQSDTDDVHN